MLIYSSTTILRCSTPGFCLDAHNKKCIDLTFEFKYTGIKKNSECFEEDYIFEDVTDAKCIAHGICLYITDDPTPMY